MTTVVDELILKFSLDPSQFNRAQQQTVTQLRQFEQQARSAGSGVEDSAQRMTDGFSRVTKEILGLGTAFLGVSGLKDLVVGAVQSGSALHNQAQALNVATEAANRYAVATQRAGGSYEAGLQTFNQIAIKLQQLKSGAVGPEALGEPWLQALGLTANQFDPAHPEQFIDAVVRGAHARPDRRAAIMEGTGLGALMPLANRDDYQKILSDSLVLTDHLADNAEKARDAFAAALVDVSKIVAALTLSDDSTKGMVRVAMAISAAARGDWGALEALGNDVNVNLGNQAQKGKEELLQWGWDKIRGAFGGGATPAGSPLVSSGDGGADMPVPRFRRPNAGSYTSADVDADVERNATGGVGTGKWIAPYLNTPMRHGSAEANGFGNFGSVTQDNSSAINIAHVSITPPPGTDAHAWASTFISSVTAQASSGSR